MTMSCFTSYLFCVHRVGLTQQQKILGVEGHEQRAVDVEVPEPRGQALQPTPPDEQDYLWFGRSCRRSCVDIHSLLVVSFFYALC